MANNTFSPATYASIRAHRDAVATGGKRYARSSTTSDAIRVHLYNAQGGECWDCGKALSDPFTAHYAHVLSWGGGDNGWMPGAGALAHGTCNQAQRLAFSVVGNDIPWQYVAPRVSRIPATWPTRSELVAAMPAAKAWRAEVEGADMTARAEAMRAEAGL